MAVMALRRHPTYPCLARHVATTQLWGMTSLHLRCHLCFTATPIRLTLISETRTIAGVLRDGDSDLHELLGVFTEMFFALTQSSLAPYPIPPWSPCVFPALRLRSCTVRRSYVVASRLLGDANVFRTEYSCQDTNFQVQRR